MMTLPWALKTEMGKVKQQSYPQLPKAWLSLMTSGSCPPRSLALPEIDFDDRALQTGPGKAETMAVLEVFDNIPDKRRVKRFGRGFFWTKTNYGNDI